MADTSLEQERYRRYAEAYNNNQPEDPEIPLNPDGTPAAGATKTMTTRKGNHGASGMRPGSQTGKNQPSTKV